MHLARLWAAQLLSALGDRFHQVAFMWIAVEAVGARAGWVAGAGTVARLAFALKGGVWADRWDRRRTMVATDLARAAVIATIPIAWSAVGLSVVHLAIAAALLGLLDAIFQPALQASLPDLAPDPVSLQRANAMLNLNHRLAMLVGTPLTGALLTLVPMAHFFTIDAATFVLSGVAVASLGARIRSHRGAHEAADGSGGIREALAMIRPHAVLVRALVLLFVSNVTWACCLLVGLPLLARDVLRGGPETYGYLLGAYGLGNAACNLALARRPVSRRSLALVASGICFGGGYLVLAWAPSFPVALAACAFTAIGGPLLDLMLLHIIQTEMPPSFIGRVFGFRTTVSQIGMGLGYVVAGPLLQHLGIAWGIAAGAVPTLLVTAWLLTNPLTAPSSATRVGSPR